MSDKTKTKIYLFCDPMGGDFIGYAMDEHGLCITSHLSSSIGFSKHDLGLTSNWKHDIYQRLYPDGYDLEWVDDPDNHEGWKAAYALNQAKSQKMDDTPTPASGA